MINSNTIKNLIDQYSIISFDIFDTLVLRNVIEPTDIFKIIEQEYSRQYPQSDFNNHSFYSLRIQCEQKAREQFSPREDVTLDNIYDQLNNYLEPLVCERLKKLELKLEQDFIIRNEFMKDIFDYTLHQNKQVILISDMYLPQSFIEQTINNLGFIGYDKLYVSCEHMKTKHHSTLYSLIQKSNNLNISEWLHIGDNYYSDVLQAQSVGIQSLHYLKVSDQAKIFNPNLPVNDSILTALEINQKYSASNSNDYWFEYGYNIAGRLFLGLGIWLTGKLKNKPNSTIHFLARDGYLVKKIYEQLIEHKQDKYPSSNYLYTSRRAFQFVETLSLSVEELLLIITGYNPQFNQRLTVLEILNNVGLDPNNYTDILIRYELSLDTVVNVENNSLKNAQDFLKFIIDDITTVLEAEKSALLDYLEQSNLVNNPQQNFIFDIGWRGSIQKALQQLINKPLQGFYLGTNPFTHDAVKNFSSGYLFQEGNPSDLNSFVTHYLMIFELLFSAPHGSLISFKYDENNMLYPLLSQVENNENLYQITESIQNGVLAYISNSKQYLTYIHDIKPQLAIKNLKNNLETAAYIDLMHFSQLSNSVGFGDSEDIKKYVSIIDVDIFDKNPNKELELAKYNLWPNALLIRDKDRLFTVYEYLSLKNSNSNNTPSSIQTSYIGHGDLEILFFKKIYNFYKINGVYKTFKRAVYSLKRVYSHKFLK